MVNVYLYGILAKEFGDFFKFKVNNCYLALKAIDVNKKNFFKKINYLHNLGIDYQIIADSEIVSSKDLFLQKRKINNIYIIPMICGSGGTEGTIGAAVAQKIGMVATNAAGQAVLTTTGQIVAVLVNAAVSASIQIGVSLLARVFTKSGQAPVSRISFGGSDASIESAQRSYVFSNPINSTSQGSSIPFGYGKTKVSSKVIWNTVKNYPTNEVFVNQFNIDSSSLIFPNSIA
jgi:predicted phage tail protein